MPRLPAFLLSLVLPALPAAAEESPFIRQWLVCGPFESRDAATRLTRDCLFGETAVCPDKGAFSAGRPWVEIGHDGERLDFRSKDLAWEPFYNAVAYAHVYVRSPAEQDVDLLAGSDDGVAAWLNGKPVHAHDVYRGCRRDHDRVRVRLAAGWNRLLLKVTQGGGAWELCARFAPASDSPVPDPTPPTVPGLVVQAANPDPAQFAAPKTPPSIHLLRLSASPAPSNVEGPAAEGGACDLTLAVANIGGTETKAFKLACASGGADVASVDVAAPLAPGHPASITIRCAPKQLAALAAGDAALVATGEGWPASREPLVLDNPEGLLHAVALARKLPDLVFYLDNQSVARALFPLDPQAHAGRMARLWEALRREDAAALQAEVAAAAAEMKRLQAEAQTYRAYLIGQSHIDLAWLWRWWPETVLVCAETYGRMCRLMDQHPGFAYTQSSAQTYMWLEGLWGDKPAKEAERTREAVRGVIDAIQAKIKDGRWAIVGGMMGEADGNLPSGESYVRQILYAKRYFRQRFGVDVRIAWQPDTFGFMGTLPQIYKKCGIDYFCTTKMSWNDTTRLPWNLFWWQAPDGSRVLADFPYGGGVSPERIVGQLRANEEDLGIRAGMMTFGEGDHGGGPKESQIALAEQLAKADVFPRTRMATPQAFFDDVEKNEKLDRLPVWNDELYLEYHRGTYTSQARTKRNNRRAEVLMEGAEKFAAWADLLDPAAPYPTEPFRALWLKVCFNQFHDILPGSSIREVYADSAKDYEEIFAQGGAILARSLQAVADRANTAGDGIPVLVFNPLSWERTDLVEVAVPWSGAAPPRVIDAAGGKDVPAQVLARDPGRTTLLFAARGVPSVGYKLFRVREGKPGAPSSNSLHADGESLEGPFFSVEIDPASGDVRRLYDKRNGRDVLARDAGGNRLLAFHDVPHEYDAWEIDKDYEAVQWPIDGAKSVRIVEAGPVRAVLRVEKEFLKYNREKQSSHFTQDVILYADLARVDFRQQVDWRERHVLIKCAYPLAIENDKADYEIAYGHIRRNAKPVTPADRARFEVSFHKWMDLTEERREVEDGDAEPLPLEALFDGNGVAAGDEAADLDGAGRAIPVEALGGRAARRVRDIPLRFAGLGRGENDHVVCAGQVIDLAAERREGPCAALALAGAGAGSDAAGKVTLRYADGSQEEVRVRFTDAFAKEPRTSDDPAIESPVRRAGTGREAAPCAVWFYAVPADPAKPLRSIVLPANPRMRLFAVTLVRRAPVERREPVYGVSFLSESKYGVSVKDGREVRMTCLRSPTWPDETADQGAHDFTYGLYPHAGGWREAGTQRRAHEFNHPLIPLVVPPHPGAMPVAASFLRVEPENVILEAVKKEEDGDGLLLRVYETHGRPTEATLALPATPREAVETDLIERPTGGPLKIEGAKLRIEIGAYEIRTVRVKF